MSKRDKIGVVIIIGILLFLGLVFVMTADRPTSPGGSLTDNPIVERRIKNLDTSR